MYIENPGMLVIEKKMSSKYVIVEKAGITAIRNTDFRGYNRLTGPVAWPDQGSASPAKRYGL